MIEVEVLQHLRERPERCIVAHDCQREHGPDGRLSGNAAQALERCIARRKKQIPVFQFPRLFGEHVCSDLLPADKRFGFSRAGIIRKEFLTVSHQQPSVCAQAKPGDLGRADIGLQCRKRVRREFAQFRQFYPIKVSRQGV